MAVDHVEIKSLAEVDFYISLLQPELRLYNGALVLLRDKKVVFMPLDLTGISIETVSTELQMVQILR